MKIIEAEMRSEYIWNNNNNNVKANVHFIEFVFPDDNF